MTADRDETDGPRVPGSEAASTAFDPVAFLADAVQTPSHDGVEKMRRLVVTTLERVGDNVDVGVDEAGCVVAERVSVAPEAGPHLVMNTHLDTVTPHVPFERDRAATGAEAGETGGSDDPDETEGASEADVLRGRGACDATGPLASLASGFLAAAPTRGRLTLAVTPADETRAR